MNISQDPYLYAKGYCEADSELWLEFFRIVDKLYPESKLLEHLYAFRTAGANLKPGKKTYVIRPVIDPQGMVSIWYDIAKYEEFRDEFLKPYADQVRTALIKLTELQEWKQRLSLVKILTTPAGDGLLKEIDVDGAVVTINGEDRKYKFEECMPF